MSASTAEYLDLKRVSNYFCYLVGISVESAAVLTLMTVGYLVSVIGFCF